MPFTVAVTVTTVAPAPSATVFGVPEVEPLVSTLNVMPLGAASSSLMVTVAGVMVRLSDVPDTLIVSLPSCRSSCVGVRSNVPVLLASPAAMVMSKFVTVS